MPYEAWLTLSVVFCSFVLLAMNWAPPDIVFVGGAALLAVVGIISPAEAFAGFSNQGMLTVAMMFVIAAGLRETGVLDYLGQRMLRRAGTERSVLARLAAVVLPTSAFLNNTPIVAMFVPMVTDWCRRHRVSPSKLLIPLSFFAILGR